MPNNVRYVRKASRSGVFTIHPKLPISYTRGNKAEDLLNSCLIHYNSFPTACRTRKQKVQYAANLIKSKMKNTTGWKISYTPLKDHQISGKFIEVVL